MIFSHLRETFKKTALIFNICRNVRWVHSLDLDSHDRSVTKEGGSLSDKHMQAAPKLLTKQFPLMSGLQSTLLSEKHEFAPVSSIGRLSVFIYYK